MALTLYSYWRSSCSWRVRIALHHKGLAFETVPVHLLRDGGEQFSEAHRRRNPMAQVPVLADGELVLTQSMAIIEYLEERHPVPALLPAEPAARARVRAMAEVVNSGIQPLQNLAVIRALRAEPISASDRAVRAFCARHIARGLTALERLAARDGGRFAAGDEVTVADLFVVPQMYNARRFDVDLTPYPHLTEVDARLADLPAFAAAHPDRQPDRPD